MLGGRTLGRVVGGFKGGREVGGTSDQELCKRRAMDGVDKYVVCINIASVIGIWYLGWCYWYLVLGVVLLVIGIGGGVIGIWYWGWCYW